MKKAIVALTTALSFAACTSVETATVSSNELAANGEAMAVIQGNALGLSAIFYIVDLVQADLDLVINKLLVSEAKAMGANKIDVKDFYSTPRQGVFALLGFPWIINFPYAQATGVAVR